ncbi:unnamed protein product, partial [Prorocentrum cordatum]
LQSFKQQDRGGHSDYVGEGKPVDLDKLYRWAQSCKTERGESPIECQQAQERYSQAVDAKNNARPHAAQLTQGRLAREKLEKEERTIYEEVKQHEKSTQEAQERLAKRREHLEVLGNVEEEPKDDSKDNMGTAEPGDAPVSGGGGKRQKKYDSLTLWTFNGSGWGTIKEKIEETVQGSNGCGVAEHVKVRGYRFGGVAANATTGPSGEAGASDGVAAIAPRCIGMTYLCGKEKWDISPRASPGRATAAWLSVSTSVIYASVYLWTAEGMTYRNTEIINKVTWQLETLAGPWIIGGDFQVEPEKMAEVESVKAARARAIASGAECGTCKHAHGVCEIDYFIVSDQDVGQVMQARAQEEWPSAPHKPVGLTRRLKVRERLVRVLEKPKALPELAIGCTPAPPRYMEIESFSTQKEANSTWATYMRTLEQEAFAARGMDWAEDHPSAGRAEEPTWRIKPLSVGGESLPPSAPEAIRWRWLARTLLNLQGAYNRIGAARAGEVRRRRIKEATAQEHQFITSKQRTKHISTEEQGRRRARGGVIAAGLLRGEGQLPAVQQRAQEGHEKMRKYDRQLPEERRAKWADKLEQAASGAAGGLHRWSKAATVRRPRRAATMEEPAGPIAAAEHSLPERNEIWRVGERIQEEPRPWEFEGRDQSGEFTDQDVEELKVVARAFRKKTGIGVDRWHPSMLQGASDDAYRRSWDCTGYAKAAEDAAWEVLLSHEMDDAEDQSEEMQATITAVLDLVKAFEKVGLHVLWEAGKQVNYNVGVLAVVCSYFATTRWRMYVDDLCVRVRQQHKYIVNEFSETIDACFAGFEQLGLKFSVGSASKGAVMASTKWARKAVAKDMLDRGIPVVRACPYLGVDIVAYGTAAKTKSGKWYSNMKVRSRRLLNMKGGGRKMAREVGLIFKCGLKRSVLHGCKCLGMPLRARDFPKHAKNAAKKVLLGGVWTMAKLSQCNIVPTDICMACGKAVGTEHHRYYKCEALREQRLQAQADWQTVAEQQDTNMLWTRGLVRTPEADWTFVSIGEDQHYGQAVQGDEDYFTGDIVCDGSKLGYSEWAQTGWAAMSLTDEGSAKMQLWGPLPCTLPIHRKVKRAEIWAFLKVLERMMPPGRICTDHKGILEGLQKGERWRTSWKRPHANIWKRIWHKVKNLDLDVGCVKHVKAHRSKTNIEQLEGDDLKIAKGNSEVDLLAKAGTEIDANFGKHQALEDLAVRVRWALQNLGWCYQKMAGEWPHVPKREKGVPRRRVAKPLVVLTKHEVVEKDGWQVCMRCGLRAASRRMRKKLWQAECIKPSWKSTGASSSGAGSSLEASVAMAAAAAAAAAEVLVDARSSKTKPK